MATISIDIVRQEFPDMSDTEAASHYACKHRHVVILRYKSDPTEEYDKFATCDTDSEVEGYFKSQFCHDVEIVYDRRPNTIFITEEMIIEKKCERCRRYTSQESLSITGGDDFHVCGTCTAMFCRACYIGLPLTEGDTGYGKCPECDTPLSRALPGTYAIPGGNSLRVIRSEPSKAEMEEFIARTLSDPTFQTRPGITPDVQAPKGSLEQQLIKASGKSSESWEGNINEVNRLIAAGADINAIEVEGYYRTALMEASIEGHLDIVNVLLSNGANVDIEDYDGRTALMFASQNGHKEIVIRLIEKGADLLKRDNCGDTALKKALRWGRDEVVSLIKERIAAKYEQVENGPKPVPNETSVEPTDVDDRATGMTIVSAEQDSGPILPSKTADLTIHLVDCQNCGTAGVLPMKGNLCPNCKHPLV